jgi:hypothetical protein
MRFGARNPFNTEARFVSPKVEMDGQPGACYIRRVTHAPSPAVSSKTSPPQAVGLSPGLPEQV